MLGTSRMLLTPLLKGGLLGRSSRGSSSEPRGFAAQCEGHPSPLPCYVHPQGSWDQDRAGPSRNELGQVGLPVSGILSRKH